MKREEDSKEEGGIENIYVEETLHEI